MVTTILRLCRKCDFIGKSSANGTRVEINFAKTATPRCHWTPRIVFGDKPGSSESKGLLTWSEDKIQSHRIF